jgi:hypothetical protein
MTTTWEEHRQMEHRAALDSIARATARYAADNAAKRAGRKTPRMLELEAEDEALAAARRAIR